MSADRIDVLAVMDELNSAVCSEFEGRGGRDLTGSDLIARGEQARAAVAELIETAGLRTDWINGTWYVLRADGSAWSNIGHADGGAAAREVIEARRAALARVGGAA